MKKSSFRVLARHKWVSGATITESVCRDSATDENGVSIRRFTATIRGFRNWKIYEGPAGNDIVGFIINLVTGIRDKIDEGDIEVFDQPNKFVAIEAGWQKKGEVLLGIGQKQTRGEEPPKLFVGGLKIKTGRKPFVHPE